MVFNDTPPGQLDISIVIPMFNEEGSVAILHKKLVAVLETITHAFEIIYVDDGSTDNSVKVVSDIAAKDPRAILIELRTNMGKSRGLAEGFKAAGGDIIVTMDADLQDDPEEIPNFLKKLDEGYDLVSGWKKKRQDPLEKRWPSKLFNKATSLVTGMELHDFNCGFKAYRKEILSDIRVYGDLHRYLPALAYGQGYKIGEIPVQHHARQFGKSKYGFERYLRGLFDLFTVTLLTRFIRNPMTLFGGIGIIFLVMGFSIISFLTVLQAWYGSILGHRPLSFLAVLLILLGGQTFSLGMLAEFLGNISRKKGLRRISIKNRMNFPDIEAESVDIGVIVTVCNSSGNIVALYENLIATLDNMKQSYEIIFVDDGSENETNDSLSEICASDRRVRLIQLRKRFGKASALNAGFCHVRGDIVAAIDGDLQDDPANLLLFADQLASCDMVIGNRMNVPFNRKLVSIFFSRLVLWASGLKIHDFHCGLKVFRKHVVQDLALNDGAHRFLPVLVAKNGYKVAEVNVAYNERNTGQSKYNWTRLPQDCICLLNILLLSEYYRRPLHLFGSIGLIFAIMGLAIGGSLSLLKFITGTIQGHNTMLLLGVVNIVFGFQWISCGMLGEIIADLDEKLEIRSRVKRKTRRF